ncbi:MAG: 50S ribosomal protein L5 [Candidatus Omnitrophica bacterium CG1_02_40_15]|nr:MAG: 50S ribosomal protein L5 [Candidatus Omnitrophica bacterium CG1_02_40_15]
MTPRLLEQYRKTIVPALSKKFGYKNAMQAPMFQKIVLNMGIGSGSQDIKFVEQGMADMAAIAGQKPVITRAKKAIANFKIRKGLPIGCKVTLRGNRLYEFLDRFLNMALPRIRDFRGTSPDSFDEKGNYSIGIKEVSIFPEIDVDKVQKIQGMDIIMNIKSRSKEESHELLKLFGMPFANKEK